MSLGSDCFRGDTRPFCTSCQQTLILGNVTGQNTCFAHRRPQLLQRSRFPLGPLLHSGVTRVWQLAQSFSSWPIPFLLFLFFFRLSKAWRSSASTRFCFSICLNSNCQLVLRVVLSSSNMLSSDASASSWLPIMSPSLPACVTNAFSCGIE